MLGVKIFSSEGEIVSSFKFFFFCFDGGVDLFDTVCGAVKIWKCLLGMVCDIGCRLG